MDIEKPYQPTKEEIQKAEDMMTDKEKAMSKTMFEEKEKEIIEKIKSGQINSRDNETLDFEKEKIEDMKKNAPLFFIYRDNTLFKNHIPTILKKLTEMGRQVDTQIFPEGTKDEDIKKWYEENKKLLSKKAIVSDQTANIPYKIAESKYELGFRRVDDIDRLAGRVFMEILFGGNLPEGNMGNLEKNKRFMTAIIKNILENPDQHPKEVHILSNKMGSHIHNFDRERIKKANEDGVEYFQDTKDACEYIADKVKEWLIESGLESEKIKITYYSDSEQKSFLEKIDKPGTWIITDRHTIISNDKSGTNAPIRSAIVLKMPPGDFYDEAKKHNLISYSEEAIDKEWDRILKNEFGKG